MKDVIVQLDRRPMNGGTQKESKENIEREREGGERECVDR